MIACRATFGKHRKNGQRHFHRETTLFRLQRRDAIANVLATEPHSIAAPKSGIEEDVKPNPLARTYGPAMFVSRHLFLSPDGDAAILWPSRVFDAERRIYCDVFRFDGPRKETAHSFEEMPRLGGGRSPPIAAGNDGGLGDPSVRLIAGTPDDLPHNGFALLARFER
jgi:hypothetical protein